LLKNDFGAVIPSEARNFALKMGHLRDSSLPLAPRGDNLWEFFSNLPHPLLVGGSEGEGRFWAESLRITSLT